MPSKSIYVAAKGKISFFFMAEMWYIYPIYKVFFWGGDIYRGEEFLVHVVVLFLVFWETFILCSTVTVPIYILTNSVQGFSFLHIFANIFIYIFFWW